MKRQDMVVGKQERGMRRLERSRLSWSRTLGECCPVNTGARLTDRMTGANMNLVTVNVKLGENDPEPEQKLEPVCTLAGSGR